MFGTDQAAIVAAAERIRAQAAAIRAHRLGEPDELKEEAMPRGVYDRKKPAAAAAAAEPKPEAETKPARKKPGRKAAPKAAAALKPEAKPKKGGKGRTIKIRLPIPYKFNPALNAASTPEAPRARFGVFDDGSVKICLPGCVGILEPEQAREFIGFLKRIGVPA